MNWRDRLLTLAANLSSVVTTPSFGLASSAVDFSAPDDLETTALVRSLVAGAACLPAGVCSQTSTFAEAAFSRGLRDRLLSRGSGYGLRRGLLGRHSLGGHGLAHLSRPYLLAWLPLSGPLRLSLVAWAMTLLVSRPSVMRSWRPWCSSRRRLSWCRFCAGRIRHQVLLCGPLGTLADRLGPCCRALCCTRISGRRPCRGHSALQSSSQGLLRFPVIACSPSIESTRRAKVGDHSVATCAGQQETFNSEPSILVPTVFPERLVPRVVSESPPESALSKNLNSPPVGSAYAWTPWRRLKKSTIRPLTCPSPGAVPHGAPEARLPGSRGADARVLGRGRHFRSIGGSSGRGGQRVRLLRRSPVRERAPPLRAPAHRLRERRRAPLPDDARKTGRTPVRLGLSRPPGRDGGRERARDVRAGPAIIEYGIARFNDYCRTLVQRTTDAWERYVTRQARWVDFGARYRTMDLSYMESVMWAFKSLYDKGLIYEGERVLPYCWECETPLSNFETRQDDAYRPRQDHAVTVPFTLDADDRRPARPALRAVASSSSGRRRRGPCRRTSPSPSAPTSPTPSTSWTGEPIVLAEARVAAYEPPRRAEPLATVTGAELVGRTYRPLFDFFADHDRAFRVLAGDFVATDEGTGDRAHGSGLRRRGLRRLPRRRASPSSARSTTRPASPPRSPPTQAARLRRQPPPSRRA